MRGVSCGRPQGTGRSKCEAHYALPLHTTATYTCSRRGGATQSGASARKTSARRAVPTYDAAARAQRSHCSDVSANKPRHTLRARGAQRMHGAFIFTCFLFPHGAPFQLQQQQQYQHQRPPTNCCTTTLLALCEHRMGMTLHNIAPAQKHAFLVRIDVSSAVHCSYLYLLSVCRFMQCQ